MSNLRETFQEGGFVRLNGFFSREDVESVRTDAKRRIYQANDQPGPPFPQRSWRTRVRGWHGPLFLPGLRGIH